MVPASISGLEWNTAFHAPDSLRQWLTSSLHDQAFTSLCSDALTSWGLVDPEGAAPPGLNQF